jgi:hypothetical protein
MESDPGEMWREQFAARVKTMSAAELCALSEVLRRQGVDDAEEIRILLERVKQRSFDRRHGVPDEDQPH